MPLGHGADASKAFPVAFAPDEDCSIGPASAGRQAMENDDAHA